MDWTERTHRTEIVVAWFVATGVAAAGAYDFEQGRPPEGLFSIEDGVRLTVFLGTCLVAAISATALILTPQGYGRSWFRLAVLAVSILPAVLADPTYGSLLLAVPLIDIRRRDSEPSRTIWTVIVVGIVGWLLISEETPRVIAEVEAMFGLAIAFFIIIMFGDALRQLDKGVLAETELAQLGERSRLADELHDSVGHHLLASSVQLQKAKALQTRDPAASAEAVDYAAQAIAEAISETRLIVDATRNNHAFRIEPAIRDLTKRVVPATTVVTFSSRGVTDQVDSVVQVALYRVAQEALSNLVRHASATTAEVAIGVSTDSVRLEVTDNGDGFEIPDTDVPGGVKNMRRRIEDLGGSFDVTSTPAGTSVVATVPL